MERLKLTYTSLFGDRSYLECASRYKIKCASSYLPIQCRYSRDCRGNPAATNLVSEGQHR